MSGAVVSWTRFRGFFRANSWGRRIGSIRRRSGRLRSGRPRRSRIYINVVRIPSVRWDSGLLRRWANWS